MAEGVPQKWHLLYLHIQFSENHCLSPTQLSFPGDCLVAFLASWTLHKAKSLVISKCSENWSITFCFPFLLPVIPGRKALFKCLVSSPSFFCYYGTTLKQNVSLNLRRIFSKFFCNWCTSRQIIGTDEAAFLGKNLLGWKTPGQLYS